MQERIAIIDGIRSPFCKSGGVLQDVEADDLGALVVKELLRRCEFPLEEIDEVVVGNAVQPVEATNIARVIALKAGLPVRVPAYTVQRNCASGFEAVTTAANKLLVGKADVIVAAATESMSKVPLIVSDSLSKILMELFRAKSLSQRITILGKLRPSYFKPVIGLECGLTDSISGLNMGLTAEVLAREFSVTREQQDEYALQSHLKVKAAIEEGRDQDEVMSLPVPPRYKEVIAHDDGVRMNQTTEALAKLRPYFDRLTGTVTAGNASQVTDGAVALLLMRESTAKERGWEPLGYLRDYAYAGLEGRRMGLGPVFSTARLLDRSGLTMEEFDLVELNEAFAAQVIACLRAFESREFAQRELNREAPVGAIDPAILNVNGGAIALGHPVGATGARLALTALKELHRRKKQRALATLCVGGGQGGSLVLEVA